MKLSTAAIFAAALPLAAAFAPAPSATRTSLATNVITSSSTSSVLNAAAVPQTAEMPEKYYFKQDKETPQVLGGIKIGLRKLCVVTGASSGLGLNAAATLCKTGRHFVVMAVRDVEKGKRGELLKLWLELGVDWFEIRFVFGKENSLTKLSVMNEVFKVSITNKFNFGRFVFGILYRKLFFLIFCAMMFRYVFDKLIYISIRHHSFT